MWVKYWLSHGLQNLELPINQYKFHNLYPNDSVLAASITITIPL